MSAGGSSRRSFRRIYGRLIVLALINRPEASSKAVNSTNQGGQLFNKMLDVVECRLMYLDVPRLTFSRAAAARNTQPEHSLSRRDSPSPSDMAACFLIRFLEKYR